MYFDINTGPLLHHSLVENCNAVVFVLLPLACFFGWPVLTLCAHVLLDLAGITTNATDAAPSTVRCLTFKAKVIPADVALQMKSHNLVELVKKVR